MSEEPEASGLYVPDDEYTRRQYLLMKAIVGGASWAVASEAVDSTALAHPEWDMTESKTWKAWETR